MDLNYLNDPEFKELIRKYLKYLQKELVQVKGYIKNDNFNELRQFGHNLKGTGGGYGFNIFTTLGEKINLAAHEVNIPQIEVYVSEFEKELTKAVNELNIS